MVFLLLAEFTVGGQIVVYVAGLRGRVTGGFLLSLLAGALSLGVVTMGMVLGHWYLVSPRLSPQPLVELTLALIAVLLVQTALVLVNIAIPVRHVPVSADAASMHLAQDPAF